MQFIDEFQWFSAWMVFFSTVKLDLNQKKNIWKIVKLRTFPLRSTLKIPENSREPEIIPGNFREQDFSGNSREFPVGISRETALKTSPSKVSVNSWKPQQVENLT